MRIVKIGWPTLMAALLLTVGASSLFSGHDEPSPPAATADTGGTVATAVFAVG